MWCKGEKHKGELHSKPKLSMFCRLSQYMQNIVLINNSRAAWPIKISMPFLSFQDNMLWDACITFQNSVDNLEVAHKICSVLVWGAVSP